MRVVALTTPHHLYAGVVLRALLAARPGVLVAAFESTTLLPGRSYPAALGRYLAVAGPRYVAAQALKSWAFRIGTALHRGAPDHPFAGWRRAARAAGTELGRVADVNAPSFLARLRAARPDVLLSVFFNQVLGPAALAAAPHAWNVHPAALPRGRGVSPVFWGLARGEREAGVTWHAMVAAVDAGPVLAREVFAADAWRTEHGRYLEAARRGARLLPSLLDAAARGAPPEAPALPGVAPTRDSLPTRAAYRDLRARGAALFTLRELVAP